MIKITYGTTKKDASELNEDFDCAVKAVAIACQIPYKEVHAAFKAAGRKDGKRTPNRITLDVLEGFGIKFTRVTEYGNLNGKGTYTVGKSEKPGHAIGWIGKSLPEGNYMVFVKGRVAALVDGEIQDWTAGRRHSVQFAWKIENPRGQKPAAPKAVDKVVSIEKVKATPKKAAPKKPVVRKPAAKKPAAKK